jgi:Ca2+-binding RTX toxin-like protein
MPSQLYVFDSRVELPEGFLASLTASDLVLVIDERADGVAVLRDYLAGREPLAAIHLISHGGQGFFTLGCTVLDNTSMASYRLALADIGAALVSDGDLLIYGCNVAQGAQGQAFVHQLAQITQADLAASSDATGAANAGGNGQLEVIVGAVETPILDVADFSTVLASSQANWLQGTAAGDTLQGTAAGDTLAGLGGQDVLLGAGGGDDLIGGPGDDVLDGGAGEDTAWFLGKRAAYSITPMADGTVRVTGPDGTDTLISVEQLRFTDSAVAVSYSPQAAEYAATGAVNGDQMAPSLAALWTDGAWGTGSVLAWESQNGDDHDVFVQGFLQSGLPMTEPLQVNSNTQTKASQAQVVGLLDGGWLVTWQSWESPASAAIMARRYRADGQALGEEFSVSSQAGINANPQVSVDNRGEWSIVWSNWSAGIASIHARDYSSQGASSAAPRVVATSNDSLLALPAVQRSWFSSDVVVAWTEAKLDGSQVLYATYAGDGSAGQATLLSGDAKLSSTDRLAMVPMRDVALPSAVVSVQWISDVFGPRASIESMRLWEDRSAGLQWIGMNHSAPTASVLFGSGWVLASESKSKDTGSDIQWMRFDGSGKLIDWEVFINSQKAGEQTKPTVTGLQDGGWLIGWQTRSEDGDWDLHAQRFDRDGRALTAVTSVDPIANVAGAWLGTELDEQVEGADAPDALAGGRGKDVLRGMGGKDQLDGGEGDDLLFGGLGDDRLIGGAGHDIAQFSGLRSQYKVEYSIMRVLVVSGPDGKDVLTDIEALQFSEGVFPIAYSGAAPEFKVNTNTAGSQISPSVTAMADGGWLVSWTSQDPQYRSPSQIYTQRYSVDGLLVGLETLAHANPSQAQEASSVIALAGGGWVVAWASGVGGDWQFDALAYASSGIPSDPIRINSSQSAYNQSNSAIAALSNGDWLAVWSSWNHESGGGVYAQRFSASGVRVGGEFKVSDGSSTTPQAPAVTGLKSGGWAIAWHQYDGASASNEIHWKAYGPTGAPVTVGSSTQFVANSYTANPQSNSAISGLADGGWVVAWHSNGQDGDYAGIYAQRYDSSGLAVGAEFHVSTQTVSAQESPAIAALKDGGWLISWESVEKDDRLYPEFGIYAQRYSADGSPVGGEFRVAAADTFNQYDSAIAARSDGGWISAWTSVGQDGSGGGIYAQVFDADGKKPMGDVTLTLASPSLNPSANLPQGTEDTAYNLSWDALTGALEASDPQADALSLRIEQIISGSLSLNGVAVTPGKTLLSKGQSLIWTPPENASGLMDALLVCAFDGVYTSPQGKIEIAVAAVNDAPMILGPTELSLGVMNVADFSAASGKAFSISDVDAAADGLWTVGITVAHGQGAIALLGPLTGLTAVDKQGEDGGLGFTGTLAQINQALAGGLHAYLGVSAIKITATDGKASSTLNVQISRSSQPNPGELVLGDGSGGGGGGGSDGESGGQGGRGGGGSDSLMGSAGSDVIFGDGSGGGGGGAGARAYGAVDGAGGAGGAGADLIQGGLGNDILFGDGFGGANAFQSGGGGGLGGGGGGGAGGNYGWAVGGRAGLGGGGGSGPGSGGTLVEGLGEAAGKSAASTTQAEGRAGNSAGPFGGYGGGGGFGGASGGGGGAFSRTGAAGSNGNEAEHRYLDTQGSVYGYLNSAVILRKVLIDYPQFGAGNDTLNGGPGSDEMFGLGGADTFVIDGDGISAPDVDRIWDMGVNDRIVLRAAGEALHADYRVYWGPDVLIDSDGDGAIDDLRIPTASQTSGISTYLDVIDTQTLLAQADGSLMRPNTPVSGSLTINGTAMQGATLQLVNGLSDADGIPTSGARAITYQWSAGGSAIANATGSSFTLTQAQVGKAVTVTASYTDRHDAAESLTSAATPTVANANDAPTGSVTISGTAKQGQVLTASNTLLDVDGIPTTGDAAIKYQWLAGGANIAGANGNAYTLTQAEVGKAVSVKATYTDLFGKQESVASSNTAAVAALEPLSASAKFWKDSTQVPSEAKKADAVNLNDAIGILKMIVGLPVNANNVALTPYQAVAADFDQSGAVDLSDAIGVLKMVVGLSAPTPTWKYFDDVKLKGAYSASQALNHMAWSASAVVSDAPIDTSKISLVGVLTGDVDGSWIG